MAASSTGSTDAFLSGVDHPVNESGHANNYMLGNDARDDQGLTDDSDRWNDLTPQGVSQAATSGQSDPAFEQLQRQEGSYSPGQMPGLQDRLSMGSDNAP